MKFENLTCENCGGKEFQKISDDEYLCHHCRGLVIRPKDEKTIKVVYDNAPKPDAAPKIFVNPLLIIGGIFILALVFVLMTFVRKNDSPAMPVITNLPRQTAVITPLPIPTQQKGLLKTEIVGNVKGGFNFTYIKCLITNVGETVIERPSVSLTLYKNDVKIDTVHGNSDLDYLKPQQTVPVWINLFNKPNYTYAKVNESSMIRAADKAPDKLFPQLKYVDAEMTTEIGTSSFNGQLYKEKFYDVKGVVINDFYENSKPQLYVIYYDADGEIIGISSTYPPAMKKGEKAEFKVSMGEKSLFGVPKRFEIIAVDTRSN